MKNFLATLFFLGIATTGFSQTRSAAGSAFLSGQTDDSVTIKCEGEQVHVTK